MAPMASMAHQAPLTHSVAFLARRAATALAAAVVLGAAAAPAAFADTPSPKKLPEGLYGTKEPQYDGVWRQSLALLAQDTVGVRPAASAVNWLVGQQCADGSFTAYRAEPGKACDAKTMRDTNQTAAAVQALAALGGHGDSVKKAVNWLKSVQNDDGGWSSMAGSPSDANSTSVVIGALAAAGEKPESVTSKKGGKTPYEGLLTFQLGCHAKEGERGAFTFQLKGAAPNADATAAAATGALGKGFVVEPAGKGADRPVKPLSCKDGKPAGTGPAQAAEGGAAYLVAQLDKNGQHLLSAMPGAEKQPDVGNTADAVVALAAGGHGAAAQKPLKWLEKNSADWAKQSGPAAYAQLVLTAHATGTDPRSFGGTDLVAALNATGPKPAGSAAPSTAPDKNAKDSDDNGGGIGVWWVVAVGLAIGAGIGFLMSGRKKKNEL
ncbi:prenyltransferase/squalene oxidase repeat-containing protein [Streptomyces inhibens]|uniref:prenyltransferase/squalene oxidase repeat-containing protein n=1 Tax=Streptomyces inhibens TaxID=2293571 RepID=UPI001EE694B5|nr:prenyltransferase/squalene oxidase repeat-containing protein [Streptomyces inhibens]UKY49943.1 terpene cyclase/mutase family protein [Streptomyces inhibens]